MGYSFGAHVATEIARFLHCQHQAVQLVLVDSSVDPESTARFASPAVIASVLRSCQPDLEHSRWPEKRVVDHEFLAGLEREVRRNLQLMTLYRMEFFTGTATFLRTGGEKEEAATGADDDNRLDVTNGYQSLLGKLRVERLIGDHFQLFSDENVVFNGEVIRRVILDGLSDA